MKPCIHKINGLWWLTFFKKLRCQCCTRRYVAKCRSHAEAFAELKSFYDAGLVYRDRRVGL